ncbi:MAG: PSD1 and planctomycete cytochrome C domain-containing protein, partial [Isosphaeraceae bacterium]
ISFTQEIRPILARHCYACHGPDQAQRKAKLRLDTREGAFADRGGWSPVAAGDAEHSGILERITSTDKDEVMPPGGPEKRLSPEEISKIRAWIIQGAPWADHWAFQKPVRAPLPFVKDSKWPTSPIDHFVLARAEANGLKPNESADKRTLIRRLSLDLTGLPPTPEQVIEFLNDSAPDAYSRLVERFLASPAYGERWARIWLDLARFADTKGYEKDRSRPIWRYRDWVIAAFNRDLPYDQFTTDQLAGDMLPGNSADQRLATAFHRNTLTNEEGGTDDEEFRIAAVKDRIDTTMQVWMGLTFGCAKCHSHKYDPISQTDYYRFFAVFNQTADADRGDESPFESFPTDFQQAELRKIDTELGKLLETLKLGPPPREMAAKLKTSQDRKNAILAECRTPVFQELPEKQRRVTKIHNRGNFLDPGTEVQPATPDSFPKMAGGKSANRLTVSQWLFQDDNPLTARVAVNRYWAAFFGSGLVPTQEDFGSQGQPPSNPELLDYLSVAFRESGWSMKALCRMIVNSSTYRQSATSSPEKSRKDPENRWLARFPRTRLEAEMIRDSALRVSGLLSGKMFGPSVMPYQPEGIWRSTYNTDKWQTSPGEDRHRRGLYTFVKRTSPYPAMITLDAPSREYCNIRRIQTNTPLQALVTLNDSVYVEAAQALARRAIRESAAPDIRSKISSAVAMALLRPATAAEVDSLVRLYDEQLAWYSQKPAEAEKMATLPLGPLPQGLNAAELAAMTNVANVILNLDEFLTKP